MRGNLIAGLEDAIAKVQMKREPCWTESVAVGSRKFLEKTQPLILSRRETEIVEAAPDRWILNEAKIAYRTKSKPKNDSKTLITGSNR